MRGSPSAVVLMVRPGKEKAAPPDVDEQREAPESVVASQEGQWRAGTNRQLQPAAHAHQVAASQAAASKRKETAMSHAERKAKKAKHMAEVRELQAKDTNAEKERKQQEAKRRRQKRAQQKAERVAAAEMANQLTLRKFNTFMLFMHSVFETDWVPMDGDEWDAFIEWLSKQQDGAEFDRSTCEGFYDGWCDSNDYAAYQMELNYESVLGDAGWDPSHEREGPDE